MTTLRDDEIQTLGTDGNPLELQADTDGDATDADADDSDSA